MAVGLATHAVPATHPDAMSLAMATDGGMDTPMSDKCNGCAGDEKGVISGACSAFCGSLVALPLVAPGFDMVPVATLEATTETTGTGHADPPDPYPPKPIMLS